MAARRLHLPSPVRSLFSYGINLRSLPTTCQHIAIDTPHHASISHRGSHSHGHLHGNTLDVWHCRIRVGEPVSPRQYHRVRHRHEPLLVCARDHPFDRHGHRKYPFEALGCGGGTRPRGASDQEAGRLRGTPVPRTCSLCVLMSDAPCRTASSGNTVTLLCRQLSDQLHSAHQNLINRLHTTLWCNNRTVLTKPLAAALFCANKDVEVLRSCVDSTRREVVREESLPRFFPVRRPIRGFSQCSIIISCHGVPLDECRLIIFAF